MGEREDGGVYQDRSGMGRFLGSVMHLMRMKFLRFATVGVVNGLICSAVTAFYLSVFGVEAKLVSVLGYLTVLPFAFLVLQRQVSQDTRASAHRIEINARFLQTVSSRLGV